MPTIFARSTSAEGRLQTQTPSINPTRGSNRTFWPAVFSVDLGPELRLPRFAERISAENYIPRKLDYGADVDAPKVVCTQRFQPRPRPKIIPAPDSRLHAYERVMQLLTGSTVEKKGEMLTGSPESQVEGIIAFLKANEILEPDSADQ